MSRSPDPTLLVGQTLEGLRMPHKLALGLVAQDLLAAVRVQFLAVAADLALIPDLVTAVTPTELARRRGLDDEALLRAFLDVGVSVGELRRQDGAYALHGPRARALADPRMDALLALFEGVLGFHEPVYQHLGDRLRGAPPGDYLDTHGAVIARASRMAEAAVSPFLRHLVGSLRPTSVLDAGCGSGAYLRVAAEVSPELTGVGVDDSEAVIEQCRANLAAWGLEGRFEAHRADFTDLPPAMQGPYDLVLLFQNIYYFPEAERVEALARVRRAARPGTLALVTTVAGDAAFAAHFDLVLRSTRGAHPLPHLEELTEQLGRAGFAVEQTVQLSPVQPLVALVARPG